MQPGDAAYGALKAPPRGDMSELRRKQAEFAAGRREVADQNSWMAVPALAPVAVVGGIAGASRIAAELAPAVGRRGPLVLTERMPYLRVGDNWATRAGRRAHAALEQRVNAKTGWDAEQNLATKNGVRRPDVLAPARKPDPKARFQMELKPDTPTGRKAAARAVRRYEQDTGNKTRAIFYDPKDFM